ncbi:uncharacterized protein VICG_00159 [Vittaforma corneae ATCC 50505]|uniref:Uncharacterized protein n=1 Tax=Vittaforma corneae (strain ATCC 50505) TaxID=993615 RepID=L2GQE5_VITCO|nr:uncharacterized protein VICG_00159 [Vittaforma corneae ATCC 50505]ELA42844.1 hypothetical protein VICG_00159 [Vittaforma corneae ATCC 50505]
MVVEIFYRCEELMSFVDDRLFLDVISNWFVLRNGLLLCFQSSKLALPDYLSSLNRNSTVEYTFLIERSRRVVDFVNQGRIFPFMTDCRLDEIKLSKSTFRYLICRRVDIPSLMAYCDLSNEEVQLIAEKIVNDQGFRNGCRKFIEDQGILSSTMLIIASLCNAKAELRNSVSPSIHKYYCGKHFDSIYMPFSAFYPILELSQLEVYFLYLFHKSDIKHDLEDIVESLKTNNTICEMPNSSTILEPSFFSIDCRLPATIKERSTQAQILDLVLSKGYSIGYDPDIYKYLPELQNETYFQSVCKKFAREIIEDEIFDPLPVFLKDISPVLDYLRLKVSDESRYGNTNTGAKDTRADFSSQHNSFVCSLDTLHTSVLLSSSEFSSEKPKYHDALENRSEIDAALPLLYFRECEWLDDDERLVLLEYYMAKLDINVVVDNFLCTKNPSAKTVLYFTNNIQNIDDKLLRARVCCKLSIPFNSHDLSEADIKFIVDMSDDVFQLRQYMYSNKISKTCIAKFISKLTAEQTDVMLSEIDCVGANPDFLAAFITHITSQYEFSYICNLLSKLLDLKVAEIVKKIQKYLIRLFNGLFVQEDYIPLAESLYSRMLGFEDCEIKSNNDKILILIGSAAKMMKKEPFIGNLKANE